MPFFLFNPNYLQTGLLFVERGYGFYALPLHFIFMMSHYLHFFLFYIWNAAIDCCIWLNVTAEDTKQ